MGLFDFVGNIFDNVLTPWDNIENLFDPGELISRDYDLWEQMFSDAPEDEALTAQNAAMEAQLAIARDQYARWEKDYKPYEQGLAAKATTSPKESFAQTTAPLMGAPKEQAMQGLMTKQSFPATGLPKQTQGVALRAAGNTATRGLTSAYNNEVMKQPGRIESVLAPMYGIQSSASGTLGNAGQLAGGLGRAELEQSAIDAESMGNAAYGLSNYLSSKPWNTGSGLSTRPTGGYYNTPQNGWYDYY